MCKKEPCFRWPKNSACLLLFSLRTRLSFFFHIYSQCLTCPLFILGAANYVSCVVGVSRDMSASK